MNKEKIDENLYSRQLYVIGHDAMDRMSQSNVLIYGAGSAGRQLMISLESNLEIKVVGFLDDDPQFHQQIISGQIVYNPSKIDKNHVLDLQVSCGVSPGTPG